MNWQRGIICGIFFSLVLTGCQAMYKSPAKDQKIIIIGHRGASGYLPEHTLAAYELAIDQGADYIEPDLVSTKDGVLIARHENNIADTTDALAKFPKLKTSKIIDGRKMIGVFTEDLTLKEIKTLKAKQRLPQRDQQFNQNFEVPTFEEILKLVQRKEQEVGRRIGLYPETKHPSYFDQLDLSLEEPLVHLLKKYGYQSSKDPVFIQSFEVGNLKQLKTMTALPLIQLIFVELAQPADLAISGDPRTYGDLLTKKGLKDIAKYASGVGLWKEMIITHKKGELQKPNDLIARAKSQGLLVHVYTFRNDKPFLPIEYGENPIIEYLEFFKLGLDGVFTDFPDTGITARSIFQQIPRPKDL